MTKINVAEGLKVAADGTLIGADNAWISQEAAMKGFATEDYYIMFLQQEQFKMLQEQFNVSQALVQSEKRNVNKCKDDYQKFREITERQINDYKTQKIQMDNVYKDQQKELNKLKQQLGKSQSNTQIVNQTQSSHHQIQQQVQLQQQQQALAQQQQLRMQQNSLNVSGANTNAIAQSNGPGKTTLDFNAISAGLAAAGYSVVPSNNGFNSNPNGNLNNTTQTTVNLSASQTNDINGLSNNLINLATNNNNITSNNMESTLNNINANATSMQQTVAPVAARTLPISKDSMISTNPQSRLTNGFNPTHTISFRTNNVAATQTNQNMATSVNTRRVNTHGPVTVIPPSTEATNGNLNGLNSNLVTIPNQQQQQSQTNMVQSVAAPTINFPANNYVPVDSSALNVNYEPYRVPTLPAAAQQNGYSAVRGIPTFDPNNQMNSSMF